MKTVKLFPFLLFTCLAVTATGQVAVSTISDEFPGSGGVKLGSGGKLYIGNFGQELDNPDGNQVWSLDLAGNRTLFATGLQGASGNAFDQNGDFYQSNIAGAKVSKVSAGGGVSTYASTGISCPVGIVFDQEDNLYVCNCCGAFENTIRKVTPSGESTQFAGGSLFSCPNGITIDPEGNLYVANFNDGRVIRIDPEGNAAVLAVVPGGNNGHLAYSAADNVLYVNSHGSSRVYRLTLDGELTIVAGNGLRGNQDGPGNSASFSRPNGIAVSATGDTLFLNSSIPLFDEPATGFFPLNPSVVRMITGLQGTTGVSAQGTDARLLLTHRLSTDGRRLDVLLETPRPLEEGSLLLLDIRGQVLQTKLLGSTPSGRHEYSFELAPLPSGIYVYTLQGKEQVISRRFYLP
ncbi:MAG: SMP-30/gluconolactonase/LRE family protein [Saprospiraceae bacterium]|nr:SMP-30/gluconolactonase/LRE family protein [Saprospiraceae bacterium]